MFTATFMFILENLDWGLSVVGNLLNNCAFVVRVTGTFFAFDYSEELFVVREWEECVYCLCSMLASLFVTKNKIDPFVKVIADVISIEGLAMFFDEILWTFSPWGKNHIIHSITALLGSQFVLVSIKKNFRHVEQLWNQLLKISSVVQTSTPCGIHGPKQSISNVKVIILQSNRLCGVWFNSYHIVEHYAAAGVVGTEVKPGHLVLPRRVTFASIVVLLLGHSTYRN